MGGSTSGETGEMPEMSGEMSGGMSGGMSGEMGMGEDSMSMSAIVLTGEIVEYLIPVGTPVDVFGTTMTFSQISAEYYLSITLSEDGTILSISILG